LIVILTEKINLENKNSFKLIAGFISLAISIILYIAIFLMPFLDFMPSNKIKFGIAFYIASYLFMFIGFWCLGKEIVLKIKQKWKSFFKREK
tara:strand:- start:15 stop:290 length:276 start_codon:yes stop_codon:yes gene_type:complete